MRPATLLFTIFAAVAAAATAAQGEMPGMEMGNGGGMDKPSNMTKPKHPKDGDATTLPNGAGAGGKPDEGSGGGKPEENKDGGKPARSGADSLAPTLLFAISAAGLAALVA